MSLKLAAFGSDPSVYASIYHALGHHISRLFLILTRIAISQAVRSGPCTRPIAAVISSSP